ncbi:MAG: ABC transporter ATP-binding protein/permease [Mogibacterium sp.]|nr:ABC transporter ATP-binding protein/permease [Mogibacterium sp.]
MSHTIELRRVSKYYAAEDSVSMGFSRIDLNLDIGEFVAITGESGSGKSTLLNVISGLDTYEEGEMFVCGEDTTAYSTEDYEVYRKTYIGNIFQDFNLINSYTVYQNIEAVMLLSGKKRKECKERVLELIDLVGLSKYRRTKASRLSGGQKQRVAIARALAKNAPIIVADEPTGNLDSASAQTVMETLAKVSRDKLVVIVTHNYEQAEPYVTRKLTMHDGKIIEDKKVAPARLNSEEDYLAAVGAYDASSEPVIQPREGRIARAEKAKKAADAGKTTQHEEAPAPSKMRKGAELRLGVRNTFNLPAKFILLFIVYFFVSTAVLSQYAATKSSMHEDDLLGSNPYFVNTSTDRIIVKKADESSFTDADFAEVESTPNIKSIVKNDLAVDSGVSFSLGDAYIEGPVLPLSDIEGSEVEYGHMPENDYEIMIGIDSSSDAMFTVGSDGDNYIGKKVVLKDMSQMQTYEFSKDIKVAGIVINENYNEDSGYSLYGYSKIYASENVANELLVSMMAASSKTEMNFGGIKVNNEYDRAVYSSSKVPDGKVFLFEDQAYYYEDEVVEGKSFGLKVKNRFFESEGSYTVDKIITYQNCKDLIGIAKDEYDMYYNCVFISDNDFKKLFDRGFYQISAFMENEQDSEETLKTLNEKGFTTLALKDSLSDMSGGFDVMLSLMTYGRLLIEFIILFFIAYAVIRLIMRSRNSYYSTLRILGATKRNTDNILRVELILMMLIAYGVDILIVFIIRSGILQNLLSVDMGEVTKILHYLTLTDYAALGAVLLLMSLLIANRYSRRIFTRSAMKAFREGA